MKKTFFLSSFNNRGNFLIPCKQLLLDVIAGARQINLACT